MNSPPVTHDSAGVESARAHLFCAQKAFGQGFRHARSTAARRSSTSQDCTFREAWGSATPQDAPLLHSFVYLSPLVFFVALHSVLLSPYQCIFLVHRIAAFAFAFAMAISRCQWRHRCVVTLGKFLVVLYSKPLWRKEKWKQRPKGDVCDVKNYYGRC